jgi:RNA polymerase sigma factor (sigma-70 family)
MRDSCPDEKLIEEYLKGSEVSLEILIKRHLKPIFSFIYRRIGNEGEAEDITQEVFLKVWKNIKNFDRKKSFKAWIFTIAKNASIDFFKKKRAILFSELNKGRIDNFFEDSLRDKSPIASQIRETKETYSALADCRNEICKEYRDVLSLRYDKDLSFGEISSFLREPLNTVKSRCRRAVLVLRKLLPER